MAARIGPATHRLGRAPAQPAPQTMTRVRARRPPTYADVRGAVVTRTRWPRTLGRVTVYWSPGLVLCDYDGPPIRLPRLAVLVRLMALRPLWVRYERTRRGWHVVLRVRERLRLTETVSVQAILGSDPYREAFDFARARTAPNSWWAARANLLFGEKLRWRKRKR